MGIKGLCSAPLAGPGGTQRPTVQCIAMKVQELEAAEWKEGGKAGCSSLVPAVPPLSLLPSNPTSSHWRDRLFVPTPVAYFPHLTPELNPYPTPRAWLAVALNIHNTNPANFPSSQSPGGG